MPQYGGEYGCNERDAKEMETDAAAASGDRLHVRM